MGKHRQQERSRKYSIQQTWDVHHEIMRLSLVGMKQVDIANHLGITPAMVSYTLNSAIVKDRMACMHAARDMKAIDVSNEIRELAPKAVRILDEIMETAVRDADRLRAAQDVLDRAGHAAVRTIKTENLHAHFSPEEIMGIKERAREIGLLSNVIDVEAMAPG